jgi:hypothetical protein
MKTLKRTNNNQTEYKRVKDHESDSLVKFGWSFCPKTEWKTQVRDFGKEPSEKPNKSKKAVE